ncbi:MAG TPA: ATP-binding cassette domain-containing protein, partial [Thermoanaerobaculia bacterium]|nr:ATP-binding cassette domain-containing protein [Thermoanaerobaculia bacterium]
SGGEKARVLLARVMLRPADLLILDEPTNDLDIPTLEVLEESLLDFPGALILVTHDRLLMEGIATHILALDGRGNAESFADVYQWEESRRSAPPPPPTPAKTDRPAATRPKAAKKLTWKEEQELLQMEGKILAAEEALAEAEAAVADPAVATDPAALSERCRVLDETRGRVEALYARWAELEEKGKATPESA